jgi:hypothetical protein
MAWRIDSHVIRGEIDNRVRGRVTGRIWFAGTSEPVRLELTGNPWRDLAGRRIEFSNAKAGSAPPLPASIAPVQTGPVGDMTASRKVKVPDIPIEQVGEYYARGEAFPWHWGNCVYFEWYSPTNGRVVIESADFEVRVSGEPAWEFSAADEEEQRRASAEALKDFMEGLSAAGGRVTSGEGLCDNEVSGTPGDGAEEETLEAPPLSEVEADKFLEDSDRLVDRVQTIMEEELERRRKERGDQPLTPEEEVQRGEWIEAMNRAAEEAANDPDLDAESGLDAKHPLAERAFELSARVMKDVEAHDWAPEGAGEEHPVIELVSSISKVGAKLAGALDGRAWPPDLDECGLCIAWLKRARRYGEDATLAIESCAEEKLMDLTWIAEVRGELAAILPQVEMMIVELRERLR